MNIDLHEIYYHLNRYRNFYIVAGLVLLLSVGLAFAFGGLSDWLFWRGVNKDKQNVNAVMNDANTVRNTIENLKRQEFEQQVDVNQKRREYKDAQVETDEARELTNKQLELTNAVQSKDYTNSTLREALEAMCKAFPDSPDCR